jgi:hypothetical protein
MSMTIAYPCSNSTIPPNFTAWGTYTTADNPSSGTCKATCTSGGSPTVNGSPPHFRSDGIWTSQISGLVIGSIYKLEASYVPSAGGSVAAPTQTALRVFAMAIPVPAPSEETGPTYAPVIGLGAAIVPAAVATSARTFSGNYPAFLGIRKVFSVVHKTADPIVYFSVTPGIVRLGSWTVVVPRPADIATTPYIAEILFLDANGLFIDGTRLNLY